MANMSMREASAFLNDLCESVEVGAETNILGNYKVHDLVQLDNQTVGVIFDTERDSFRVLDQNGRVWLVQPHQISLRCDSNRAIATDTEWNGLRVGDDVKEIEGEDRKGRILHVHQSVFAFLHNCEIMENNGIFVTPASPLVSLTPKGNVIGPGSDLSNLNPTLSGDAVTGGVQDPLVGVIVTVAEGRQKGYIGTIKGTDGPNARVELHTNNKIITIEKQKLHRRSKDGKLEPL